MDYSYIALYCLYAKDGIVKSPLLACIPIVTINDDTLLDLSVIP